MDIIGYQEKIEEYKIMSRVCIELLDFKDRSTNSINKYKLKELRKEIIENENYNKIKTVKRKIQQANYYSNIDTIWEKFFEESSISKDDYNEYDKYIVYIRRLKEMGSKEYLIECLEKIKYYQEKQKEEQSKSINNIKHETLDEIIKKHISERNPYLEKKEIEDIKDQFGLDQFGEIGGYLSGETIEKLFILRIVTTLLNKHEEVQINSLIDSMDTIFDLAVSEIGYKHNNLYTSYSTQSTLNYERVLNRIKDTNNDYEKEYSILYEKIKKYLNKTSKEEQEEFARRIKSSRNIEKEGRLLTPSEFRIKINSIAISKMRKSSEMNFNASKDNEINKAVKETSAYTKYMTAEEIANYYIKNISNLDDVFVKFNIQEIFARLIEQKMNPINSKLSEEEQDLIKKKRLTAICKEYFNEERFYIEKEDITVESNYAKIRIQSSEIIKQSANKYYIKRKANNMFRLRDYNKFKELEVLSKEEVLTEEQMQKVKRMF